MTSGYSRPQKFVRELTGVDSLAEAESLRQQPFWLIIHEDATARLHSLVRALVAVASRSCSGKIVVRTVGEDHLLRLVTSVVQSEAGPYGCLDRVSIAKYSGAERTGPGITIGMCSQGMVTADASGTYAAVNYVFPSGSVAPHGAAACFAAAIAFAKYFSATVLRRPAAVTESWSFSIDSLSEITPPPADLHTPIERTILGKLHLLGAGAIGSSFCFSTHLSDDGAEIEIIDREKYDDPNQETTFFLSRAEAVHCPEKAVTLARLSSRPGLRVVGHPAREIQEGDPFLKSSCGAFVCAVDNPETRCLLDAAHCGILLNGGLGGTSLDAGHVLVTWHNGSVDSLASLYSYTSTPSANNALPPREITDDCSRLEYESVSLAAPFVALASGALLHALCRLNAVDRLPRVNYLKLDLLGQQRYMARSLRARSRKSAAG